MAVAVFMLGFNSYLGFSELFGGKVNGISNENYLKRIYSYAKELSGERSKRCLLLAENAITSLSRICAVF